MATTLYPVAAADGLPGIHRGDNTANLAAAAVGWVPLLLRTTRGGGVVAASVGSVLGPTNGIEVQTSAVATEWISLPVDQSFTLSGTVTFNVWAAESNMSANGAVNVIVQRMGADGSIISTIAQSTHTAEAPVTTRTAHNFTATPTSTNMLKGDRIRVRIYFDDSAAATMAATFNFTMGYAGTTGAADGDTFITFTENFGFLTTEPAGSILYLTSVAGPAVGANNEREMWETRGGSATTAVRNTATGWTAPLQWTDTAGGTAIEWYSKPLQAFTLSGLVECNLRIHESNASANAGVRAELAVCNGDGSSAVVWGAADLVDTATPGGVVGAGTATNGEPTTSQAAVRAWLAGIDTAVTVGQRLRLRAFIDDSAPIALATGQTVTLTYDGPTGGASGDSWIQLPFAVTEYVVGAAMLPDRPLYRLKHILGR